MRGKVKLIPHQVILVDRIPDCNFCGDGTPGPYDFATYQGSWANGCERHWTMYRASAMLGTGSGQLWVTADQVEPEPAKVGGRDYVTDDEGRPHDVYSGELLDL